MLVVVVVVVAVVCFLLGTGVEVEGGGILIMIK